MNYQTVETFIRQHTDEVGKIQSAFMSSIGGLVYSEFLKQFQFKQKPVKIILVPDIKNVKQFLSPDQPFMQFLSLDVIDKINSQNFPCKAITETEEFKQIFTQHTLPYIASYLPVVLERKFELDSSPIFRPDRDKYLFKDEILGPYIDYVADEFVLNMIASSDDVIEVDIGDRNHIEIGDDILSVNHENAITPINFSKRIFDNSVVFELLSFVTSTEYNDGVVETGDQNQLTLYRLK